MNKRIKKGSLHLALLIVLSGYLPSAYGQYDSLLRILDSRYPQEKMYMHFDKAYYNPGETIWFKAYLFTANIPSQISKTLYAELWDEDGKLIERKMAPVVLSSAAAAFDLPSGIKSSVVYIRAYTDWMLNFDSAFLYHKTIPLVQGSTAKARTSIPRNFLQFFPEGGDQVEGITSRVAFKATDVHGLPYEVQGEVVDSKGKAVTAFKSVHDGMGFFTLGPEPKEKYTAVWKDAAGKSQRTPLPVARKSGLVLETEQQLDAIGFSISKTAEENDPNTQVYIVGQMQQQMVYMASATIPGSKTIKGNIPTENIPAGLLQITVFSKDRKPLAERLVFVNKQDYYFITDLNAALKGFDKRRKNVFQIDVPDTISTNLSVAVTDAGLNPARKGEEDIFSNILLTSDIKGYVHNPGYYFSSDADSVAAHLDLVMMTNGWRRFRWEEVLAGKFPQITHIPADYLTISGQVNGLTRSQLTQQELTGILEVDKKQQFISIPVEPSGKFSIPGMLFFDTAKLYYQFNNDKDRVLTSRASFDIKSNLLKTRVPFRADTSWDYRVVLPGSEALARNGELADKNLAAAEARKKVQTLATVTVTAHQKSKEQLMDEEYTSGMFSGGDGYTFITDDDISAKSALSVLNYLQGKVAGLQISGQGSQMSMSWRGGSPTLFLNEMQSDVSMVQSISMADVAMVKVFRPPFYGAPGGGSGGAIAIYTKKGAAANTDNVKGLDFANIPGYSPIKEFYSPDYSKYDERHTEEDYRPTLYWQPYLLTGKDTRRVFITFYNNDITRKFRIVIEGCNADGKLTRIEKVFE